MVSHSMKQCLLLMPLPKYWLNGFDANVKDSSNAKVYRQFPAVNSGIEISQGESVDIFLTQSESVLKLHDPAITSDDDNDDE